MSDFWERRSEPTSERDEDSNWPTLEYESDKEVRAAVDCCRVSWANWLRESSACINW